MPRTRPPYPPVFREGAVRMVRENGKTMGEVARDLGVSAESVRKWVWQYEIDAGQREGLASAEGEELQRLQPFGLPDYLFERTRPRLLRLRL